MQTRSIIGAENTGGQLGRSVTAEEEARNREWRAAGAINLSVSLVLYRAPGRLGEGKKMNKKETGEGYR